MAGSGDLFDLADEYLGACYAALADTPGGIIDRAFVSYGVPAWDCCPQLSVHVGGPAVADTAPLQPALEPGHRLAMLSQLNLVSLTATVIRCVPTVGSDAKPPAPNAIHSAASVVNADLWAIWNHVAHAKAQGLLFGPKEREFFLDPAVSIGAAGGCAGWQIQVRVQLGGYFPA